MTDLVLAADWPTPLTVAFASDHAGAALKTVLRDALKGAGIPTVDLGADGDTSVDYPDYAAALAAALANGRAQAGVLVCGSGIGISMAANRYAHVRAALVHDHLTAQLCRSHNGANVLALGGRLIGTDTALDCLRAFFATPFEGGRHVRRVEKLGRMPALPQQEEFAGR